MQLVLCFAASTSIPVQRVQSERRTKAENRIIHLIVVDILKKSSQTPDMTRASKASIEGGNEGENDSNMTAPTHPIARKAPRTRSASVDVNMVEAPLAGSASVAEDMQENGEPQVIDSQQSTQQSTHPTTGKGKKRGPKIWTEQKENRLIEMYKERPFMYNMKHGNYHNRYKKVAAMREMVKELKVPGM